MNGRTWSIMRKELIQIIRDPRTLAIMFLIPVVQLILLGYAATTDIKHLPTAIWDGDRTPQSRALIEAYRASDYFDLRYFPEGQDEVGRLIDGGQARAGMIIRAGYADDLLKFGRAEVLFIIDGSDPAVANTALAAAQSVGQAQAIKLIEQRIGLKASLIPIDVRPRVWYNPDLKSANFMIPGLMGIILQFLTTMLTAMSIVRERERGTMEQLIVTPVRPLELMVGKILPYIAIAFFDSAMILLLGSLWFGVGIRGSLTLLMLLVTLFLLTSLGMGLLISTVSKTQQEAMLLTWFLLLPAIFLGGFFFPIEAMPMVLQAISYLVPLRYLLIILRTIILKGAGLEVLQEPVIALLIFGPLLMLLAARRFRKRLA